ncbi:hypothetical protein ABK040_013312 [Willaertia magna]
MGKQKTSSEPRKPKNQKGSISSSKAANVLHQTSSTTSTGGGTSSLMNAFLTKGSSSSSSSLIGASSSTMLSNSDKNIKTLHPTLQALLKHLNKKDATTRLKALQSITNFLNNPTTSTDNDPYEYHQSSNTNVNNTANNETTKEEQEKNKLTEEYCKQLLPYMPEIFKKIAILDFDRRVRLQLFHVFKIITQNVGKDLGRYLKQILPYWLMEIVNEINDLEISKLSNQIFLNIFKTLEKQEN